VTKPFICHNRDTGVRPGNVEGRAGESMTITETNLSPAAAPIAFIFVLFNLYPAKISKNIVTNLEACSTLD
jgi:hypothetical protein